MFTPKQLELMIGIAQILSPLHPEWGKILSVLRGFDQYEVRMYCYACGESKELEMFSGHHVCRHCGDRICDTCHDIMPFCCIRHEDMYRRGEAAEHYQDMREEG